LLLADFAGRASIVNLPLMKTLVLNSLGNALHSVHSDTMALESAIILALHVGDTAIGFSKVLNSLTFSFIQVLLEGSSMLDFKDDESVLDEVWSVFVGVNHTDVATVNSYPLPYLN
jgi:hypothetical protein